MLLQGQHELISISMTFNAHLSRIYGRKPSQLAQLHSNRVFVHLANQLAQKQIHDARPTYVNTS